MASLICRSLGSRAQLRRIEHRHNTSFLLLFSTPKHRRSIVAASSKLPAEPDFDDLVLDEEYYRQLGISPEELEEQRAMSRAYGADPEGFDLNFDDASSLPEDIPEEMRAAILNKDVYGPPAMIMAGFMIEEYAMARAMLDTIGGRDIKVLPCGEDMLQSPVEEVLWQPEIDWSQPRPDSWIKGGGWGSVRTIVFSGLSIKAQATIMELLEESGLPALCATMVLQQDAQARLGQLLAEAVKEQRSRSNPKQQLWEGSRRVVDSKAGLDPVEQVVGRQAAQRLVEDLSNSDDSEVSKWFDESDSLGPVVEISFDDIMAARKAKEQAAAMAAAGPPDVEARSGGSSTSSASSASSSGKVVMAEYEDAGSSAEARVLDFVLSKDAGQTAAGSSTSSAGAAAQAPSSTAAPRPAAVPAAAAAAAAQAEAAASPSGSSEEEDDPLAAMLDNTLDDLLAPAAADSSASTSSPAGLDLIDQLLGSTQPPAAAAAAAPATSSPAAAPAASSASSAPAPGPQSALEAIQAALRGGADPEELKRLIDAAAANIPAQQEEQASSSSSQQAGAPASSGSSSGGSEAAAERSPSPPRPMGPEPAPANLLDPLINVRPEVARALRGKQVKMVDLSKMPKRAREQWAQQMNKPAPDQVQWQWAEQQALEQARARLQQQQQQQQQQQEQEQAVGAGAAQGEWPGAVAGAAAEVVEAEMADEYEEEGEEEGEWVEGGSDMVLDLGTLKMMKRRAEENDLDASRLLAEALAAGIMVAPRDAIRAGIPWPEAELVEQAKQEQQHAVLSARAEVEEQERMAAAAREAARGAAEQVQQQAGGEQQPLRMPGANLEDGPVSAGEDRELRRRMADRMPVTGSSSSASSSSSSGGKRVWGSGLKGLASKVGRSRPRSASASPEPAAAEQEQEQQTRPVPAARTLTRSELQSIAERQGLDMELILADAEARGITITDE